MTAHASSPRGVPVEPCKLITVVLPGDGPNAYRRILTELRSKKGVIRANSTSCLQMSSTALRSVKPGKLPQPTLAHVVEILATEAEADDLFHFVCELAELNEFSDGLIVQQAAPLTTPYALPEGVREERVIGGNHAA